MKLKLRDQVKPFYSTRSIDIKSVRSETTPFPRIRSVAENHVAKLESPAIANAVEGLSPQGFGLQILDSLLAASSNDTSLTDQHFLFQSSFETSPSGQSQGEPQSLSHEHIQSSTTRKTRSQATQVRLSRRSHSAFLSNRDSQVESPRGFRGHVRPFAH